MKAFIDKLNEIIAGILFVILFQVACVVTLVDRVMSKLRSWASK